MSEDRVTSILRSRNAPAIRPASIRSVHGVDHNPRVIDNTRNLSQVGSKKRPHDLSSLPVSDVEPSESVAPAESFASKNELMGRKYMKALRKVDSIMLEVQYEAENTDNLTPEDMDTWLYRFRM